MRVAKICDDIHDKRTNREPEDQPGASVPHHFAVPGERRQILELGRDERRRIKKTISVMKAVTHRNPSPIHLIQ